MLTKQLLLSSNYWVLNKDMVRMLGLETAFLLSNFAEAESMMADKEGWFYQTSDTVEDMTTLSRHKQDQCISQLEELNILEKDIRGMPAKRYFKINYSCLTNLFVNNSQTRLQKINKQVCKKSATNKESSYKELNNKESTTTNGNFSKIARTYQSNFGLATPRISEMLIEISEEYPTDWILEAMDIALQNNARNIGYIKGILIRWKAEGKNMDKPKMDPYAGIEEF